MDLSIIIISFNTKGLLVSCIKSIKKFTKGIEYEIIVVDNASYDGSAGVARELGAKVIENSENVGFAAGNNQGAKVATGKYLLFLNSDTEILDDSLAKMFFWMESHPKAGVATCALKNKDKSLQATGGFFPALPSVISWMTIQDFPGVDKLIKPFHPYHSKSFLGKGGEFYSKERELDWVTGAFLIIGNNLLKKIGGWDESYFMYVEEVDLCFRVKKAGYEVWYVPSHRIIHLGGASSKTSEFSLLSEYKGIKRFYQKFYPAWQYPFLRFFLKIGALIRIVAFGVIEGPTAAKTYAKAFLLA